VLNCSAFKQNELEFLERVLKHDLTHCFTF